VNDIDGLSRNPKGGKKERRVVLKRSVTFTGKRRDSSKGGGKKNGAFNMGAAVFQPSLGGEKKGNGRTRIEGYTSSSPRLAYRREGVGGLIRRNNLKIGRTSSLNCQRLARGGHRRGREGNRGSPRYAYGWKGGDRVKERQEKEIPVGQNVPVKGPKVKQTKNTMRREALCGSCPQIDRGQGELGNPVSWQKISPKIFLRSEGG